MNVKVSRVVSIGTAISIFFAVFLNTNIDVSVVLVRIQKRSIFGGFIKNIYNILYNWI